jgi:hypothetical protein
MMSYEYELIRMEPVSTDSADLENILNEKGRDGFRYITVQKLWTEDDYGQPIQRNFMILEKNLEEEL